jgi:hypothetical protein
MRSFWSDPYLWIHLAGFAAVPLWLELCFLGLAVGDPVLPPWLEVLFVGMIGIAPILWMQWQRPFYIFSLLVVALKPEQLTDDQRRLLTLFQAQRNRVAAVIVAIALFLLLQKLYALAPIAATIAPFAPSSRLLGLGLAAIAFLGANLFCQVPMSVLSVMLTGEPTFAATPPEDVELIRQGFTRLGFPLNQILPTLLVEPAPSFAVAGNSASFGATEISSNPSTEVVPEVVPETETITQSVTPEIVPKDAEKGAEKDAEEIELEDVTEIKPEIAPAESSADPSDSSQMDGSLATVDSLEEGWEDSLDVSTDDPTAAD